MAKRKRYLIERVAFVGNEEFTEEKTGTIEDAKDRADEQGATALMLRKAGQEPEDAYFYVKLGEGKLNRCSRRRFVNTVRSLRMGGKASA